MQNTHIIEERIYKSGVTTPKPMIRTDTVGPYKVWRYLWYLHLWYTCKVCSIRCDKMYGMGKTIKRLALCAPSRWI